MRSLSLTDGSPLKCRALGLRGWKGWFYIGFLAICYCIEIYPKLLFKPALVSKVCLSSLKGRNLFLLEQRAMSIRSMSLFFIYWKNSILNKQCQKFARRGLPSLHAVLKDCKGHSNASCSAWQFILLALKRPIYFFKLYVTFEISWKLFCHDPDCQCSSLCGLVSFSHCREPQTMRAEQFPSPPLSVPALPFGTAGISQC